MGRNRPRQAPASGIGDAPADPRLDRLLKDVARLARGEEPNEVELALAPVLSGWRIAVHPRDGRPVLVGRVTGHPAVGPGPVVTSPLVVLGPGGAWARTISRFYRLGVPAGEKVS